MADNIFDSLTHEEKEFCEFFVNGEYDLSGNGTSCYMKAFGTTSKKTALIKSKELLVRKDIQNYINYLDCPDELEEFEERFMRRKMTKSLLQIAEECKDSSYVDRRGNPISPAAMRSVAINAYKQVADLNGLAKRQSSDSDNSSEGSRNGGITFNVIVPSSQPQETKIETPEQ